MKVEILEGQKINRFIGWLHDNRAKMVEDLNVDRTLEEGKGRLASLLVNRVYRVGERKIMVFGGDIYGLGDKGLLAGQALILCPDLYAESLRRALVNKACDTYSRLPSNNNI